MHDIQLLTRCRIHNPFKSQEPGQVDNQSEAFAKLISSVEPPINLFHKAGRLASDPTGWRHAREPKLSDVEEDALKSERQTGLTGFVKLTKSLIFTIIVLWLSAIMQGWIQSMLNGANLTFHHDLDLHDPADSLSAVQKVAGTNAVVFFVAGAACFLSDPLQSRDYIGRRAMLFAAALLCLAAGIGAACVTKWEHFFACRVLLGIAMGLKASVTSVFAAEISPAHLR